MKKLIGTVIGVAGRCTRAGLLDRTGLDRGVMSRAVGLPSARDRHDIGHLKTMVVSDLQQHGADCSAIKDIEPRGKEGSDTLIASIICTSGEVYELRMHEQSPWEYRRVR